jgi:hypothetical protein
MVSWVTIMRCAVPYATGSAAACSNETRSGMRSNWCSATRHFSASPPCSISPMRPCLRLTGFTSTRSPRSQPVTPGPTSRMSPAMSSPTIIGIGTLMPGMPRTVKTSW